jgi:hypothetical protein
VTSDWSPKKTPRKCAAFFFDILRPDEIEADINR